MFLALLHLCNLVAVAPGLSVCQRPVREAGDRFFWHALYAISLANTVSDLADIQERLYSSYGISVAFPKAEQLLGSECGQPLRYLNTVVCNVYYC